MEHVVFFPAHDGTPAFRRVADLDQAVRLVEHLRNVEQVEDVQVCALTEVPLAFRAWYRVELPEQTVAVDAADAAEHAAEHAAGHAVGHADDEPVEPFEADLVAAGRNGRAADVRGLGFFAS